MLATERLADVAPEVNFRDCVTRMPLPSSNKAAYSGFETQRRRHQKSKTGVSVAPQKGLMSNKNLKQKKKYTNAKVYRIKVTPRESIYSLMSAFFIFIFYFFYFKNNFHFHFCFHLDCSEIA